MAVSCILAVVAANVRGKFRLSGLDGWSARLMTEVWKRRGGICGVVDTAAVNYRASCLVISCSQRAWWRELLRAAEVPCIDAAYMLICVGNAVSTIFSCQLQHMLGVSDLRDIIICIEFQWKPCSCGKFLIRLQNRQRDKPTTARSRQYGNT